MIQATRYSRTTLSAYHDLPFLFKLKVRLGLVPDWLATLYQLDQESDLFNRAGYAVVLVDMRGSGASYGTRPIEWSPREIEDMGAVMDWIVEQPWSSGAIGAWGMSYTGNTAELMATLNHPALKAVAPGSSDFDPLFGVGMPGGVKTDDFIRQWSEMNMSLDSDASHARAVDGDDSGRLLAEAYESHDSENIYDALAGMEYRDDPWGDSGLTMGEVSPWGLKDEIEKSGVPMHVTAGWLDACVADGAISRFMTFSNHQEVVIGPWGHGQGPSCDPLLGKNPMPGEKAKEQIEFYGMYLRAREEQIGRMIAFFDRYLKEGGSPREEAGGITYYTLGADTWNHTDIWPPAGSYCETLYFATRNRLSPFAPDLPEGEDLYRVDPQASTGMNNRWMTQMGHFVDYTADRREEDKKLLVYTTEPFSRDRTITGTPVVTLFVDSSRPDPAFHVYLEDVGPDGRVTYLTEGVLRGIHRAVSGEKALYQSPGVIHSFMKEDARDLVPGETEEISLNLNALSARIGKGHALRIALAGEDASVFSREGEENRAVWKIMRNVSFSSRVEIPFIIEP